MALAVGQAKLEVRQLSKSFTTIEGREILALKDISLAVEEGELVCILGPSGCGKSTLLRIVAGLEPPSTGEILLDGRPLTGPGPDRGMVFQEHLLFPWRTVGHNVEYGLEVQGRPKAERAARARECLAMVGLESSSEQYPKELSGGMKQRVGIARALANDPAILLMDEPFASVDAQARFDLQAMLLTIWWGTGKTILFVTHSVEEAVYLADRVVLMGGGPGTVIDAVSIDLPRPRYRVSPEFNVIRREVLTRLGFLTGE
ncbi:MAG: ABC transporter ATP-binding protein [Candidatus Methylomirabilales bacterium]